LGDFPLATGLPESPLQEVKALKTLRMRDLVLLGMALGLTTVGVSLVQSQGGLKGKTLPVVSTSDVIGYITPCG
jgi:hypothetical protein